MNPAPPLHRRFALAAYALTAAAALCRALALWLYFDAAVGYCDPNLFSTLLYVLIVLALAGALVYAILARRAIRHDPAAAPSPAAAPAPLATRLANAATILAFVAASMRELSAIAGGNHATDVLLRATTALLALLYVFAPRHHILGLCPIVYCAAALAEEYFDWTVPLNSPIKLGLQMAYLAAMLFTVSELRVKTGHRRPIRHTVTAAIGAFACIGGALPTLLAGNLAPLAYSIHALVPLSIGIGAALRLWAMTGTAAPQEIPSEDIPADPLPEDELPEDAPAPAEEDALPAEATLPADITDTKDIPTETPPATPETPADPITPQEDPSHG